MEATLVPNLRSDVLHEAIDRAMRAFLDEFRQHDQGLADRLTEPFNAILDSGTTPPSQGERDV